MKIKRIILLIFAVLLLFSACSINKEYNEMLTQIETQEISLLQFASDIDKAINNNEKPYDLLLSCEEKKTEILENIDILKAGLNEIQGNIKEDKYNFLSNKIDSLSTSYDTSISAVKNYYINDITDKVAALLNEYKDAEDKSSPDAQPSQNLVDELSSFSDKTIFDDPHLQELNIILNSFICCRDLYADWLNSSQEFAKSSVTCENKESSNKLIEDYLSQTNQYYNNHIKSVDAVLSVDEAVNDSLGLFIQIFEPYTKEYETVIDNLESINN